MSEEKKSLPELLKDPEFAKRFQDQAKQVMENIKKNPVNPVDHILGRSHVNETLEKHAEHIHTEQVRKEQKEDKRDMRAYVVSLIGIGISIVALGVSIIALFIQGKGE